MNKKILVQCPICKNEFEIWSTHKNRGTRCKDCRKNKGTRLYSIWVNMKHRCNDTTNPLYGGKGVYLCDDWNNFIKFKEWAISHGYNDNLSIDRIDNNLGYTPDNCRWVSPMIQNRNKRNIILIDINGIVLCLKDWCNYLGLPYKRTSALIRNSGINPSDYIKNVFESSKKSLPNECDFDYEIDTKDWYNTSERGEI